MQSGNKCNVAGRVDGWRAAENRAVVVLTNLADAQIGVHHVTLAGHARQVIAVADINGLAIFVAGTKGHQSVVIDGRRKEVQFQNGDRKSTRLNSSHVAISYAVFCLKKKKEENIHNMRPAM